MEIVELSQQQSARMAELPEDYRVVGVERRTPLLRKPTGQISRPRETRSQGDEQNGGPAAAGGCCQCWRHYLARSDGG